MLNMVMRTLKDTPYAWMANSIAPEHLEAFRGQELFWQVKMLSRSYFERKHFEELLEERQSELQAAQLPVRVTRMLSSKRAQPELSSRARQFRSQTVLAVFFHQIFEGDCTFLDLQYESFVSVEDNRAQSHSLVWTPSPLHMVWHDRFRGALASLYEGFFMGDVSLYEQCLKDLNLWSCREIVTEHLQAWLAPSHQFRSAELLGHFVEIFNVSRIEKKPLHPNCLAWCVYLASLYEHLEILGEPVDAKEAFLHCVLVQ